jgi:ribose transport system permease protein
MILLYALAHFVLSRTSYGRYVYAVGGNREAARLSGVPVRSVLISVYAMCGALAGFGGVIQASQLQSGSHIYGIMLELDVIAAVVVGGTSLAGGVGRMPGTLIGAFIIAVVLALGALARRARLPEPAWLRLVPAYGIGGLAAYWTIERVASF